VPVAPIAAVERLCEGGTLGEGKWLFKDYPRLGWPELGAAVEAARPEPPPPDL
jgi:hypothetical protein